MRARLFGLVAALGGMIAAQAQEAPATVDFEGATWRIEPFADEGHARVEEFRGRKALWLRKARVWRDDVDLADLVIEYDVAATHASGFIGADWRAIDAANAEQFYVRPAQSGKDDATQYMPVINGVSSWQLHAGPNDAVAVDLPPQRWIRVKIVAIGDRADIFVGDMTTPLIHAPDLRLDGARGAVSLFASDVPWIDDSAAYFSNIVIRAPQAGEEIVGAPRQEPPPPAGLLAAVRVSAPFPEADVAGRFDLDGLDLDARVWTKLQTETNGVANLARLSGVAQAADTVFIRLSIDADEATSRLMRFGYSDRVRLYVNGKQVYVGNAGWRSRDHRFLGTVGLEDGVVLHLNEGANDVVAAVSESFGGWGFKAQIEDRSGLHVE